MKISRLIGMLIGLVLIFFIFSSGDKNERVEESIREDIDFQEYNHQFAEGEVLDVLEELIGDKRVLFYLPPSRYINVSSGSSYGVVFAIQNVLNTGENYFEYSFKPADSTLIVCNVSEEEATSWIKSGQKSFGKINGDWIDKMSVYFEFPLDVKCRAIYDFKILKDGEVYYIDILEFNIN